MKTIKLSAIKPNENNPRYITEEKFEKLVNSIIMFPKMMQLRPMVIKDKTLLGGNMRRKAIAEIANRIEADNLTKKQKESILENAAVFDLVKVGEIPADWVANADDLTGEQQQEFIVKDNVGFGSWDWDALANEWDAGELAEWGLDTWQPEEVPDYDILDDDDETESQIDSMSNGVKKAIQIEFDIQDYEGAAALVKFWRERKAYVGGMILEYLKSEKEKL